MVDYQSVIFPNMSFMRNSYPGFNVFVDPVLFVNHKLLGHEFWYTVGHRHPYGPVAFD
jgi:hypothetical protein